MGYFSEKKYRNRLHDSPRRRATAPLVAMGRKKSKPRGTAQASSHTFEGKGPTSKNETEGMAAQHSLPVLREIFQSQMDRPEYWWIMDDCIQVCFLPEFCGLYV